MDKGCQVTLSHVAGDLQRSWVTATMTSSLQHSTFQSLSPTPTLSCLAATTSTLFSTNELQGERAALRGVPQGAAG